MTYQEDLREKQVVAIWAGNIKNEDELYEYLETPFESDFGFLLDYDDLPEFSRSFSEPRLHAHYNRPFLDADIRDLLSAFSWSDECADEAERLCREEGIDTAKAVVAFPNLRYPQELCRNPRGGLRFIANLLWLGGRESWVALQSKRIVMPPFPKLIRDDLGGEGSDLFSWGGIVCLESWRGFAAEEELSKDVGLPTRGCLPDGDFHLEVSPPTRIKDSRPTDAQARALQHLLENQAAIRDSVFEGILKVYPEWRESYFGSQVSSDGGKTHQSGWDLPEMFPPENMPDISNANDLKRLIKLGTVHVLAKEVGGFVRIGFGFGCKWDEEHGLGVLTHKGKVIEVGHADSAFSDV